jgi:hypothetical protein
MSHELTIVNVADTAMTLSQHSDPIKLIAYSIHRCVHHLISSATPELTRAEHKAFNMREQDNDEGNAIKAAG